MESKNAQLINVAIVDDHKVITDSLSEIIEKTEGIRVVAKAHTIAQCRRLLKEHNAQHPTVIARNEAISSQLIDVLLLDVNLPDGNGIDFCPEVRKHYPDVKILMLTSYAESNTIGRAFDVGANGYVLKNSAAEEVVEGIFTVYEGQRFLCDQANVLYKPYTYQPLQLTPRELEILKLIVDGLTIKEIANKLFLGFETVRSYHKYLHLKLDVHNTAQLVKKALEEKIV